MKERNTRRFPLVLSALATATATAAAVYYMRRYNELFDSAMDVHPELLREVREEGATLMYWVDSNGKHCYQTTHDVPTKK